MFTDYHAKYFAYELTRRCSSDNVEKLAAAVAGAQVDLNPHQVNAALFVFNSSLSKRALHADEIDLGKTIEAGLVRAQMLDHNWEKSSGYDVVVSKGFAELKHCLQNINSRRNPRFPKETIAENRTMIGLSGQF